MFRRTLFATVLFIASASCAWAAVPDPSAPPSKPSLNRASPMLVDPVIAIPGKAPVSNPAFLGQPQAALPDNSKPALNRAAPVIDDPLIRGTAPVGAKPEDPTEEYLQAKLPDKSKPPLYRASPMLNDAVRGNPIHGAPPRINDPLIRGTGPAGNGTP